MSEQQIDRPVLDLLDRMTADSIAASSLDPQKLMLVRLAALVAMDAPPVSYMMNLGLASELEVEAEDIRGMLAAIAPIVGTPRVAAATGNIVQPPEASPASQCAEGASSPRGRARLRRSPHGRATSVLLRSSAEPTSGLVVGYDALNSVGCSVCGARGCVRRAIPGRACHLPIPPVAGNGANGGSDADHQDCSNDPLHESPFVAMTLT